MPASKYDTYPPGVSTLLSGVQPSELLRPYVPRLLVDSLGSWLPERWRAIDGSLAFVDISGFTRLTERLARRGKVGAEEMSDVLNACFTELLGHAEEDGADLVKWGGDAVLLLFDGAEHAARACRASLAMQRRMATFGRLRTSIGPIRLRMSVGIHSGTFYFFSVGRLHIDVIPAGPAVTTTAAIEAIAQAGEVGVSTATAALLDPSVLGGQREGARLVRRVPHVSGSYRQQSTGAAGVDLTQGIPLRIREYVLAEQREPEHRPVTVAFLEFGGTDDLLKLAGPDVLAQALDECLTVVQDEAHRRQVTFLESDISRNGVKALLVAGAPTSAGADEERMLRTVHAIMDARTPLPLRVGVTCGRVFAGDFGPSWRRTFSIKGDAVNLAARITAKAQYGEILTLPEVLHRSRTIFSSERLEPFTVKGKSQPVPALRVGAPLGLRTGTAAALVGRQRELETLLEALTSARTGAGRIVELLGEPGVGKSRLVEELEARAVDAEILRVACGEYEAATPYFPFKSLLGRAFSLGDVNDPVEAGRRLSAFVSATAPHVLAWLPLVAIPLGAQVPPTPESTHIDERFRPAQLAEAIRELLRIRFARPTVLVFEDAHWMDDASLELLGRLTQDIDTRPWLAVVTRRGDDPPRLPAPAQAPITTIRLEPLPAEEAAALVEGATEEAPLLPHEVAALAARSGGNPLFLTQLVSAARSAGGIDALPDTVEGVLAAQIDRLTPGERMVLRYASVLGATFDVALLDAVLGGQVETPNQAVWHRLANFVSRMDGTARFRHALIRDVAYEGLPYRLRRELHARAGEVIERNAPGEAEGAAELLSLHFFSAQRFEEAWRYSRLAGDRARALYANVEAKAFYERALDTTRSLTIAAQDLAQVLEGLGDAQVRLGEFEKAAATFSRARRRVGDDPVEVARLMLKQALVPWRLGRYPQALRWIRRGLGMLAHQTGSAAAGQRARLQVWYGVVLQRQGKSLQAVEWCQRAIAEAERAGARDALAHAYDILDWAYITLGRFEDAKHSEQALAIYEELGNLERQAAVLNNLGATAHFQGRWNEALHLYERAREAWVRAGDRWSASFPMGNIGIILLEQGRLDEAETLFRGVLRVAQASHTGSRVAGGLLNLGRVAVRRGRFDEARKLFAEARAEFERDGDHAAVLLTAARTAEALLGQGEVSEALALATGVRAQAERTKRTYAPGLRATLHRICGTALLVLGRLSEAHGELTAAVREARSNRAGYELALALEMCIALGDRTGEPVDRLEAERRQIVERLGILTTPHVPPANPPLSAG